MGKVSGLSSSRKRRKKAPPAEVTPEKDEELAADDDIPGAAPDDEELNALFDEAADKAMDAIVEKLIDVDYMVEVQVFRLHKREVVAAACREAMEAKWGVGKGGGLGKAPWFEAYDGALSELHVFQDEWGIPDCPECGSSPAFCYCCTVDCQCGVRHLRYAWSQGYRCRLRCSPGSAFIGE